MELKLHTILCCKSHVTRDVLYLRLAPYPCGVGSTDREQELQRRFGARLREVRKAKGLSQLDLVRAGFGLSHYQKLERGVLDPKLSTLKKIADAFGVSVSELLTGI